MSKSKLRKELRNNIGSHSGLKKQIRKIVERGEDNERCPCIENNRRIMACRSEGNMVEVVRSENVIRKSRRVPKAKTNTQGVGGIDARDDSPSLSVVSAIGGSTVADASTQTPGAAEGKLGALRRRQRSIGAILESLFGNPDRWRPNVWGRRAYWMIAGLIYERLAIAENDIETDELIGLAKILAENRKLELLERESRGSKKRKHTRAQGDMVSGKLARAIRDVYGMEVDKSEKGA